MKQFLILVLVLIISCKKTVSNGDTVKKLELKTNQLPTSIKGKFDLEIYDYDGLKPLINQKNDKLHVVNFWATWCAPCVKELPYFETITKNYKTKNVEVLLISLDFPKDYDSKLKPFIKNNNLQSKIIALDDVNQNKWIPAIDSLWSGALPATLIYNKSKRQFYERSFTKEELEIEIQKFIQ